MKKILFLAFTIFSSLNMYSQNPLPGSNKAVLFDGIDDAMNAAQQITVYNNFTIEAWVKPTGTITIFPQNTSSTEGSPFYGGSNRYLIFPPYGGYFGDPNTLASAGLTVGSNGVCVFEHGNYYMPPILSWSGVLPGWTHIAVVYINKQPVLYVNGTLAARGLTSPKTKVFVGNAQFGGGPYGYFQGSADEIRIWNISLNEFQIRERMCKKITAADALYPNLITYYSFEEVNGDVVADKSSSNNNAVLVNGTSIIPGGIPDDCSSIYCAANGSNTAKGFIQNVFACYGFNNTTGWNGYSDFSAKSVTSAAGKLLGFSVTPGCSGSILMPMFIKTWIDWNGDGDFNDAGETVFAPSPPISVKTKFWIRVPAGTAVGNRRMRVILRSDAFPSACGSFVNGEVEDYSINIVAARPGIKDATNNDFDEAGNTFTVYPNPVSNRLTIERSGYDELKAHNSPAQMIMNDVNGKVVMKTTLTSLVQAFDMSKISNGVYFITILTPNNSTTSKIIINK